MEPAKSIIAKLGGEARVSEITGTAFTAPYRWQHSRAKGGTNGRIPQRHIPLLLDYAKRNSIDLTAAEFHDIHAIGVEAVRAELERAPAEGAAA